MENLLVGIDIESMKWLDAKDLFISSCVNQNFIPHWPMTHLLRVANCSNNVPEAKWLCRVFEHNPPFTSRTFLKWVETDPNSEWVRRAAKPYSFHFESNLR